MNFIKNLITSRPTKGIFMASGSEVVTEIAANSGFDWLILDVEHGVADEMDVLRMMRAMTGTPTAPIIRIPQLRIETIKRMLDFGASGIMCPMIETADDAANLVAFMHYPPAGKRGLSGSTRATRYGLDTKDYFQRANRNLLCVAQIETRKSVENVEAIAQVEGIDILFIGHADLSLSLGCFQQYDNAELGEAEAKILEAARKHGKTVGMHLKKGMRVGDYVKRGFSFIAVGSDIGCLNSGFQQLLHE